MDISLTNLSNLQNKVVTTAYNLSYQMQKPMVRLPVLPKDVVSSHLLCENAPDLVRKTLLIKLRQKRNFSLFFLLFSLNSSNPKDFIFVVNLSHSVLVDWLLVSLISWLIPFTCWTTWFRVFSSISIINWSRSRLYKTSETNPIPRSENIHNCGWLIVESINTSHLSKHGVSSHSLIKLAS